MSPADPVGTTRRLLQRVWKLPRLPGMDDRKTHWEGIYGSKPPEELTWFQPRAALSLDLIQGALPDLDAPILDVGGGASVLVDNLLEAGYRNVTVLDLAAPALAHVQARLGADASRVRLVQGDVLTYSFEPASVALWHDRAVFHFLTDPADRARYVAQVQRALKPGGSLLVSTFAAHGPTKCSGLDTARYAPDELSCEFGEEFSLRASLGEEHRAPSGKVQAFSYCLFRYSPR